MRPLQLGIWLVMFTKTQGQRHWETASMTKPRVTDPKVA